MGGVGSQQESCHLGLLSRELFHRCGQDLRCVREFCERNRHRGIGRLGRLAPANVFSAGQRLSTYRASSAATDLSAPRQTTMETNDE